MIISFEILIRGQAAVKEDVIALKIGEELTDGYGHVNYIAFLYLFGKGRDEFTKKRGVDGWNLTTKFGLQGFLKAMNIVYEAPLFAGDQINIYTTIAKVGYTSITFKQRVQKGQKVVAEGDFVYVMTDEKGFKQNIPDNLRILFLS